MLGKKPALLHHTPHDYPDAFPGGISAARCTHSPAPRKCILAAACQAQHMGAPHPGRTTQDSVWAPLAPHHKMTSVIAKGSPLHFSVPPIICGIALTEREGAMDGLVQDTFAQFTPPAPSALGHHQGCLCLGQDLPDPVPLCHCVRRSLTHCSPLVPTHSLASPTGSAGALL